MEVIQLQSDLVKCRSQIFEANFKLNALKTKLKKARDETKEKSDKESKATKEKDEMQQNYKLVIEKLHRRDELVALRQFEIINQVKNIINRN
jgi:chromosome segregation ATPase